MYKILRPEIDCIVFATQWHPKLNNGARIGVCREIREGVILVTDEQKSYAVMTEISGQPFHDYWREGEASTPVSVSDTVTKEFGGVISDFCKKITARPESVNQWCRKGWVIYNDILYSPQLSHNSWLKNQNVGRDAMSVRDFINANYGGSHLACSKSINISSSYLHRWTRNGWQIFNGVIYSPQRPLTMVLQ